MQFEDFVPGAIYRAGPRDVTEQEMLDFALRYDPQPFHIDREIALASRYGSLISSGFMTCGIAMQLCALHILAGSESIGSPGVDELRWDHPVRPGDSLRLTVSVRSRRVSSSGKLGIVLWQWELHNQSGQRVLSLIATSFFELQPDAP